MECWANNIYKDVLNEIKIQKDESYLFSNCKLYSYDNNFFQRFKNINVYCNWNLYSWIS